MRKRTFPIKILFNAIVDEGWGTVFIFYEKKLQFRHLPRVIFYFFTTVNKSVFYSKTKQGNTTQIERNSTPICRTFMLLSFTSRSYYYYWAGLFVFDRTCIQRIKKKKVPGFPRHFNLLTEYKVNAKIDVNEEF